MPLSHFTPDGRSRMVDVTDKTPTHRYARACVTVRMKPQTLKLILDRRVTKGDVFEVARLAGIMAAKRVHELVPLCHQIPLGSVGLTLAADGASAVRIEAEARTIARTGVEMEALTACSIAALTVYDMCKAVDRGMRVEGLHLLEKRGGKSDFLAPRRRGR